MNTDKARHGARSIALAFALIVSVVATAAVAAPPSRDCDDLPPGHPGYCGDTPQCEPETITATGIECLWTPAEEAGSSAGTITVQPIDAVTHAPVDGNMRRLVVFVRDAAPGDICVLEQSLEKGTDPPYAVSIPLEDERGTYWDFEEGHWCEPYDPVDGQREDPNGLPLVVDVGFDVRKGTLARITITP